ncbi:MAG: ABC transporter substrate-binding protein [Myxococcota bacterium]
MLALVCVAGGGANCRASQPTPVVTRPTDDPTVNRHAMDPAVRAAWDEMDSQWQADPAGEGVRAAAERLLATEAPANVHRAAFRAKAEHAYLNGSDAEAIVSAEEGLELGQAEPDPGPQPPAVMIELARLRVRALVRGGDPTLALEALEEPLVHAGGGLDPVEEQGLRAIAADRNGDLPGALVGLGQWRAGLDDGQPTALWVEHRLALLADSVPPPELAEVVADMPSSPGRDCLAARLGEPVPEGSPTWVEDCGSVSAGIGILLPRSGPFSAFADQHLAAAMATVDVASTGPVPPLLWRDSGSSTRSATTAARSLLGDGARVLVGPIGAKSVKAVAADIDQDATLIVPGETRGHALGVAPSLERRVEALIELARSERRDRLVVLAPDSGYGRRAVKAVQAHATGLFPKDLVVRTYPPNTTSFGPHVNPVMTALQGDAAVLIPDTLTRTDLVVRQLARAGRIPARADVPGLMVLATAEGVDPGPLLRARDVMEGVWVVPAAARGPHLSDFEVAYTRLQGEPPGDQALLVYYALSQAITGFAGVGAGQATLTRVEEGRLVVQTQQQAQ